jgi:predicted enzyme involved in methoxymalonyl-ACP biosynthesis
VVVRYAGPAAEVESLFMSCRVLGRGVEFAIWPTIAADAAAHGCERLQAAYRPTPKNAQAADFYDRLGLPLTASGPEGGRAYAVALSAFAPPPKPWIKVLHA